MREKAKANDNALMNCKCNVKVSLHLEDLEEIKDPKF